VAKLTEWDFARSAMEYIAYASFLTAVFILCSSSFNMYLAREAKMRIWSLEKS
jgi:hypothetical protein